MSRLRSHLSPRIVLSLFVIVLGTALIAFASSRTETGTPEQQAAVRTSRDVSGLPLQSACTVVPEKELFVREVSVVDDCLRTTWRSCISSGGTVPTPATQGAWTFGARMQSLAGTTDPATLSTFTLNWLHHWQVDQTINGDFVPARPNIQSVVIDQWPKVNGGTMLDMKKAPFRLLAIVARLDLRQNAGYSGGRTAGEARFVYNLLDGNGNTTQFNVIFEYGLDAADCAAVQSWADLWHGLGSHTFGPDYNAALQAVTDRFATIGASPAKPNGSAINQVRTNEVQLVLPGSTLWELREFKLTLHGHDFRSSRAARPGDRRPDPGPQPQPDDGHLDVRQRQRVGHPGQQLRSAVGLERRPVPGRGRAEPPGAGLGRPAADLLHDLSKRALQFFSQYL